LINGIPKKRHAKKEKVTEAFLEIGTFKEKLTPTDDGDGQVGIRKAPLLSGTAELNIVLRENYQRKIECQIKVIGMVPISQ
jgi:hypothetical protein